MRKYTNERCKVWVIREYLEHILVLFNAVFIIFRSKQNYTFLNTFSSPKLFGWERKKGEREKMNVWEMFCKCKDIPDILLRREERTVLEWSNFCWIKLSFALKVIKIVESLNIFLEVSAARGQQVYGIAGSCIFLHSQSQSEYKNKKLNFGESSQMVSSWKVVRLII